MSASAAIRAGLAFVELGVNAAPLQAGLDAAAARLRGWAAKVAAIGATFGAFGAVVLAPLTGLFKQAVDQASQAAGLGAQLGTTSEEASKLAYAFDSAGIGSEQLVGFIRHLNHEIAACADGSGEAVQEFGRLGINWQELAAQTPTERIASVADALGKITHEFDRSNAATKYFGRSGQDALRLFAGGGEEFRRRLTEASDVGATVTAEQAQQAREIARSWQQMSAAVRFAFLEVGRAILPETRTIGQLAAGVVGVARMVRLWIGDNKELVVGIAAGAAAFVVAGTAVAGLGTALALAGAIASGAAAAIGAAWSGLGAVLSAVWAPVGLLLSAGALVVGTAWSVAAGAVGLAWTAAGAALALVGQAVALAQSVAAGLVLGQWTGAAAGVPALWAGAMASLTAATYLFEAAWTVASALVAGEWSAAMAVVLSETTIATAGINLLVGAVAVGLAAQLAAVGAALAALPLAAAAVGAAVFSLSERGRRMGRDLAESFDRAGRGLREGIGRAAASVRAGLAETWQTMQREGAAAWQSVQDTAVRSWGGISSALRRGDVRAAAGIALAGLRLAWLDATDALGRVASRALLVPLDALRAAFGADLFGGLPATAEKAMHGVEAALRAGDLAGAWGIGIQALRIGWLQLTGYLRSAWSDFSLYFMERWDRAVSSVRDAWRAGSEVLRFGIDAVRLGIDAVSGAFDVFADVARGAFVAVFGPALLALGALRAGWRAVAGLVGDWGGAAAGFATGILGALPGIEMLRGALSGFGDFFGELGEALSSGWENVFSRLVSVLKANFLEAIAWATHQHARALRAIGRTTRADEVEGEAQGFRDAAEGVRDQQARDEAERKKKREEQKQKREDQREIADWWERFEAQEADDELDRRIGGAGRPDGGAERRRRQQELDARLREEELKRQEALLPGGGRGGMANVFANAREARGNFGASITGTQGYQQAFAQGSQSAMRELIDASKLTNVKLDEVKRVIGGAAPVAG